jgi:DNA-directed RNA polymerase subunit K/omega
MIDRSKLPNSFAFVVTAGARARQLLAGSTPRVTVGQHKKITVALQEVLTHQVEAVERTNLPGDTGGDGGTVVENVFETVVDTSVRNGAETAAADQ